MGEWPTESEFIESLRDRLVSLRQSHGLSGPEVASRLGVAYETYKKYETRSALPIHLIPRVCELYHVPSWYLLTGRFSGEVEEEKTKPKGKSPLRRAS